MTEPENIKHHAKDVKDRGKQLNEAIALAVEAGLRVELTVQEIEAERGKKPSVVVKVWQEV